MTVQSLFCIASRARTVGLVAMGLGSGYITNVAEADPLPQPTSFQTLDFGTTGTFLTGIRGDNIVGNYTIPEHGTTGGLYYNLTTQTWSAMPVATPNGANYPGATGSSPYGPSFGNPGGVLRVVGSYLTAESNGYDLSYLYDAAAAPGNELTELVYPDAGTLYTIAHSTFGNQLVGNYDTQLATGNAFIYNIDTGAYVTNNVPGAVSTTAYGIYGDKIAGGYTEAQIGGGLSPQHGYIYDQVNDTFTSYDHPGLGVVATHFEGITGGGQPNTYNLVVNWVTADEVVHPGVMHLDEFGFATWYEIDIPGTVVSSNSAYGDKVVGIYTDADGVHGYVATIDGIYNPTVNTTETTFTDTNAAFLDGKKGEDIINQANITATGNGGVGMRGETYGVLTNEATITASGIAGAAVEMHGRFGTLLNEGTLQTTFEADALRTDATAEGTIIVNTGIIDGRIAAELGAGKRFENSGWLGVSGHRAVDHPLLPGHLRPDRGRHLCRARHGRRQRQTERDGRRAPRRHDGGVLPDRDAPDRTTPSSTRRDEITGEFETLTLSGIPALFGGTLNYAPTEVSLNVGGGLAALPGNTPNQNAVGAAIDGIINAATGNLLDSLPDALAPLYDLTAGQLPGALDALSGEAYASNQTVLIGDSFYSRQAMLGRMRQGTYAGRSGIMQALSYGGPVLAYGPAEDGAASAANNALAGAAEPSFNGTLWAQGFGAASNYDDGAGTASVDATVGGIIAGIDTKIDNWLVGAALGYTHSSADIDALASSSDVDSLLMALYAGASFGPRNLRLGASYAFSQIDASRMIAYPGYVE